MQIVYCVVQQDVNDTIVAQYEFIPQSGRAVCCHALRWDNLAKPISTTLAEELCLASRIGLYHSAHQCLRAI